MVEWLGRRTFDRKVDGSRLILMYGVSKLYSTLSLSKFTGELFGNLRKCWGGEGGGVSGPLM